MNKRLFLVACMISVMLFALSPVRRALAQTSVVVPGNHPTSAGIADWAAAPAGMQLNLTAVLGLRNLSALEQLKAELQQPGSPNYHKWLSVNEFAQQFGPTADQLATVVQWLTNAGFTVTKTDLTARTVRFSGTVAQVEQNLATRIVQNGPEYANLSDPQIPANLSGTLRAFFGLSQIYPLLSTAEVRKSLQALEGEPNYIIGKKEHFSPQDFWTYYDQSPPTMAGNNGGTGNSDCIALLEFANTVPSSLSQFTSQFDLPAVNLTVILSDPTQPAPDPSDNESVLDVDWAHAVAPNTPITVYVSNIPGTTSGQFDILSLAVSQNLCGAISSSVDDEGTTCPDLAQIQAYAELDSQAVTQGQTLFHSSGDYGSFYTCGQPSTTPGSTSVQPSIEESSASEDVTVVGGTMFTPVYDSGGNNTSVLAPGFEQVWNEYPVLSPVPTPTPAVGKGGSGGGISVVFNKPTWQQGLVPFGTTPGQFTMRGVPDVSAVASPDEPGLWIATTLNCPDSETSCFLGDGGTSASSPIWSGISRLLAESSGTTRLGNINPWLYQLAGTGNPALVDVSSLGTNCPYSNCGTYPGYQVGPGYDLATGLGSPDINKLIAAFSGPTPTATATSTPTPSPTLTATLTPTATLTATPSVTPTTTSQPSVTPTSSGTAAPTATSTPGASVTAEAVSASGTVGQTVNGGSLTVTNTSGAAESLSQVMLQMTTPGLFSALTLTATVEGATATAVTGEIGPTTFFTFNPTLTIPAGASAQLALSATLEQTPLAAIATVSQAGLLSPGAITDGSVALVAGLMFVGLVTIGTTRQRWRLVMAAVILAAAATQAGCSGSSNNLSVVGSSQQTIPAGGIDVSNSQGAVSVGGLPAALGVVQLVI